MFGSRPRSNSVPRIDGSISDQSRSDAASTVSRSPLSSGSVVSSLNRLPLNQSTVSKPTRPPDAIARKSSPASSPNRAGAGSACRSIRVNMWSGSRPTSSANMQKTRRLTKWATACGSCPRSRNAWATEANDAATRSVSDCRVSPGRRRSGSENAHFSLSRVAASARSSSSNSWVRLTLFVQLVRIRNRTMSDTIQQWRVLQRQRVLPELVERRVEVGAPPLVFPGEVVALPDVGPAVAAGVSARSSLEAVRLTRRVGVGWRRFAQQTAQVDEVLPATPSAPSTQRLATS